MDVLHLRMSVFVRSHVSMCGGALTALLGGFPVSDFVPRAGRTCADFLAGFGARVCCACAGSFKPARLVRVKAELLRPSA